MMGFEACTGTVIGIHRKWCWQTAAADPSTQLPMGAVPTIRIRTYGAGTAATAARGVVSGVGRVMAAARHKHDPLSRSGRLIFTSAGLAAP
jgi:hypothetical protein